MYVYMVNYEHKSYLDAYIHTAYLHAHAHILKYNIFACICTHTYYNIFACICTYLHKTVIVMLFVVMDMYVYLYASNLYYTSKPECTPR